MLGLYLKKHTKIIMISVRALIGDLFYLESQLYNVYNQKLNLYPMAMHTTLFSNPKEQGPMVHSTRQSKKIIFKCFEISGKIT